MVVVLEMQAGQGSSFGQAGRFSASLVCGLPASGHLNSRRMIARRSLRLVYC
jgi:hypothetical protein